MTDSKMFLTARAARRVLAVVGAPFFAIAISLFALGGTASAHVVTSINADCYLVTVHFSQFPDAGVMVHIAADVTAQATITRDVLVTSGTSEATLDISSATAALFDATGTIDVDVTWTFQGPHHAHETLRVRCGTSTTTTSATTTTEVPTTTTEAPTTTTVPETTTSFEVLGSTTIVTPTTAPVATTTETVGPQGSTASTTTTTLPVGPLTLPRTGSSPAFPAMFGLSSLIAGALLLLRRGRAWSR